VRPRAKVSIEVVYEESIDH